MSAPVQAAASAAVQVVRAAATPAPVVSVIVPAYNVRQHLREAVDSLLAQTWHDLEVLVIDDASTDGTLQVLEDLQDPRLTLLRLGANVGLSNVRNLGLARARGEFIALLDGDDVSLPQRIEKQLAVLRARPEVGLVSCLVNTISRTGQVVRTGTDTWRGLPDAALKPLMLFTNPVPVACMVRRSAVPAHGFRPIYAEDYAFTADVAVDHELALLREPLVNYRLSPNGIMASKLDRVAEGALDTQRRLLRGLGLPEQAIDPALLRTLAYFGRQPRGRLTLQWLLKLRAWFELVLSTNRSSRRYAQPMLESAAARVWDMVLLEATKLEGLVPGPRYVAQLWPYLLPRGRASMRLRSLAHATLNVARGPVHKPDPYGRDGERT
jgi:hypothetical protein